jgi:hypothetical protein
VERHAAKANNNRDLTSKSMVDRLLVLRKRSMILCGPFLRGRQCEFGAAPES